MSIRRYLTAAQRAVQRHGGGLSGLWSVLRRTMKVLSAMGASGLLGRVRLASAQRTAVPDAHDETPLPVPATLEELNFRVGVMAHMYYPDLAEDFAQALSHIPVPFTLLISAVDEAAASGIADRMSQLPNVEKLVMKTVENRGRDIAPLLVTFHDEVMELDIIGHIHTKKSLYTGSAQDGWRRYLLNSLLGSSQRTAWILGMLKAMPDLGMVYPESHEGMPLWAHTWLSNSGECVALATRLGIELDQSRYIDFPAGSMFWARVDALRPLYDLNLQLNEFPIERGQVDGTLQHAVERLFGIIARHQGFRLGILPSDGSLALASEGMRNVDLALEMPLAERLQLAGLEAQLVSLDVFDTLVVRPFLSPAASRAHLAWRVRRQWGINDFLQLREDAEAAQRSTLGRDPTLTEIYLQLARRLNNPNIDANTLMQAELDHERQQLRPRSGVLNALSQLGGKKHIALSDMYLDSNNLKSVLPPTVATVAPQWLVSCETGLRKDSLASWEILAERLGVQRSQWLHIGDNEHADVQVPQLAKLLTPVHVLRPSALLDVIPALRPLRHPQSSRAAWPEQLWRGLLANRFANIVDTMPRRLIARPQLDSSDVGYIVLGPLLLDFLISLVRVAQQHGVENVLFLSREGYLLQQAFNRLKDVHPAARMLDTRYLLASRRATALPAMFSANDVGLLLEGTFNGKLRQLLQTRAGEEALAAVDEKLLERDVFLPEMAAEVAAWLQPAIPSLLALALRDRNAYREYLSPSVATRPSMVVDLGYAGTIQRNLARLQEQPLGGFYLALRARARQLEGEIGWAEARYFDGRNQEDETNSPILANDLLLEALLGAPSGQFNGFTPQVEGAPEPRFGPIELSAAGLEALDQVHQGALAFIDDVCAMIGEDVADIELDPSGVQIPLQCLASGRWNADACLDLLVTDDSFTGRGKVAAGKTPD